MEHGSLLCGFTVEWNGNFFSVGCRSNGTVCSSVCGTGGIEQEGLRFGFPVRMNREFYSVGTGGMEQGGLTMGYRWNGPGRPYVLGNDRM